MTSPSTPGPFKKRLRHLPAALAATGALLVFSALAGLIWRGPTAALGLGAGVALVIVSFLISSFSVAWADSVAPSLVMPVGLVAYATKFLVMAVFLTRLSGSGWPGVVPMAIGIAVGTFGWIVTQAVWTWNAKILYVEL